MTSSADPTGHSSYAILLRPLTVVESLAIRGLGFAIRGFLSGLVRWLLLRGLVYAGAEAVACLLGCFLVPSIWRAFNPAQDSSVAQPSQPIAAGGSAAGAATAGAIVDVETLARQMELALGLTHVVALAAARACADSAARGLLIKAGSDPCSGRQFAILFNGGDMPQTTAHIADAQEGKDPGFPPRPAVLSYAPGRDHTKWYNDTAYCNPIKRAQFGLPSACDEYPFNSTNENGQSLQTTSIRLTPLLESNVQFLKLGEFYTRTCHLGADQQFVVVPVTVDIRPFVVPTFGWCPK